MSVHKAWKWLGSVGWAWAVPPIQRRRRLHRACLLLGNVVVFTALAPIVVVLWLAEKADEIEAAERM